MTPIDEAVRPSVIYFSVGRASVPALLVAAMKMGDKQASSGELRFF